MFETPFTKNGTARGSVEEQWKRRTILRSKFDEPIELNHFSIKKKNSKFSSPVLVSLRFATYRSQRQTIH